MEDLYLKLNYIMMRTKEDEFLKYDLTKEEDQIRAIKNIGTSIYSHIDNPSEKATQLVVKMNNYVPLKREPRKKVTERLEAGMLPHEIKSLGKGILFLDKSVLFTAIDRNNDTVYLYGRKAVKLEREPRKKVGEYDYKRATERLEAVKEFGRLALLFISKPSKRIQLEAVKKDEHALRLIKDPCKEALKLHKALWETRE